MSRSAKEYLMVVGEGHPLHAAASAGDTPTIHTLLDQGMDVNAVDDHGLTALHRAVWEGHAGVVRVLIERGADTNAKRIVGDVGNEWTPLHLAAENNQFECARILLDAGTDPDPKDEYGQTPLFLAADQENNHLVSPDVARLLIEYGASIRGTTVSQNWTGIDPDIGVEARLKALELLGQATRAMEW